MRKLARTFLISLGLAVLAEQVVNIMLRSQCQHPQDDLIPFPLSGTAYCPHCETVIDDPLAVS